MSGLSRDEVMRYAIKEKNRYVLFPTLLEAMCMNMTQDEGNDSLVSYSPGIGMIGFRWITPPMYVNFNGREENHRLLPVIITHVGSVIHDKTITEVDLSDVVAFCIGTLEEAAIREQLRRIYENTPKSLEQEN